MGTKDEVLARRTIVADLTLNGWSGPQIAQRLDVHHSTVYDDLVHIRDQWLQNQTHTYDQWVARELQRLDYLEEKLASRLYRGDPAAIQVAIRIQERRTKYLGLDSPTRITVDPTLTGELRELAEKLQVTDDPEIRELLSAGN